MTTSAVQDGHRIATAVSVGVVVRTENSETIIADCLARFAPYIDELVVLDCGSADRTTAVAREYGARVVPLQANQTPQEACDLLVQKMSSQWVASIEATRIPCDDEMCRLRERLADAPPHAISASIASIACKEHAHAMPSEVDAPLITFCRRVHHTAHEPESIDTLHKEALDAGVSLPTVAVSCTVDVIILSYGKSHELYEMTKRCIHSLRRSERDIRFNVVVVETNSPEAMRAFTSGRLFDDDCKVVFPQKEFNYNEFLQIGFRQFDDSAADYLLIANNDVIFEEHFAAALIEGLSRFDSVTPWCPRYHERFFDPSVSYHAGYRVCQEVCGWAIMFHRRLLGRIAFEELFPRDFAFWFQDNYYAHQLEHVGAKHALITASKVVHLFEQSHKLIDPQRRGSLTAGAERVFREKMAVIDAHEEILLTVAVPAVPSRVRTHLPDLIEKLTRQADGLPVEVVCLLDNKRMTIGAKRNQLAQLAQGRFISFVDDDDDVSDDYVVSIVERIQEEPHADCIVFNALVTVNGGETKKCYIGLEYRDTELPDGYYRQPNPRCAVRSDLVRQVLFPDINWGGDSQWAAAIREHLRHQARIDRVLYRYRFDARQTECPPPRRDSDVDDVEVEQGRQPDDRVLLTIAVLSIPSRTRDQLPHLIEKLGKQAEGKPVEIIALLDNRKSTIGRKRNAALSMARGEYVAFVDDDDDVAEEYVDALLDAIDRGEQADCIVFDAWVTWNGDAGKLCRYGIEFEDEDRADAYYRRPNHLCCFRTEIARRVPFEDVSWHEDFHWAKAIRPHLHKQARVDRVLYHYRCDPQTSAADWPEELRSKLAQQTTPKAAAPISPQIESPNLSAATPTEVDEGVLETDQLPIYGFMHVALMGHWREIVDEQLFKLRASGLYEKTQRIFVGLVGPNPDQFDYSDDKLKVIYRGEILEEAEFPTLAYLHQFCQETDCLAFYVHTKGVSRPNENSRDWRRLLEYFNITRHEDCIRELRTHDVCGVNWNSTPTPHFSGGFWWARSGYIRTLPDVRSLPVDARWWNSARHNGERWIGANAAVRASCLHHSQVNHYHQTYPRSRYAVAREMIANSDISGSWQDATQKAITRPDSSTRLRHALAILTYVPADSHPDVRNRLPTAMASLEKSRYDGHVFVVDDGSDHPGHVHYLEELSRDNERYTVVRRPVNGGVSRAKNTCLKALLDHGIDVGFLAEDDVEFSPGWADHYLAAHRQTGIGHFSWTSDEYPQGKTRRDVNGTVIFEAHHINGVFLTFTPEVARCVGGFKVMPGRWGYEHINWTRRIIKAGFAPFVADVSDSNKFIRIGKYGSSSALTVGEKSKLASNNFEESQDLTAVFCPIED